MKEIITVKGKIRPDTLGFCQCHEHIALSKGQSYEINPALCIDDEKKSLEEVIRYKDNGGSSLIDAQPCGCNRMAEVLQRISKKTGVHIIASTGFHKLCFYQKDHWIHSVSQGDMEEIMMRELTEGMFTDADRSWPGKQCGARAGIIKTAFDTEELSPCYKKLFQAAAAVSERTGRILMIHVEQRANPVLLLKFLLDFGMNAGNLVFCHMDRACENIEMHKYILKYGAYLEFDTIGRFKYHSDEREIEIIRPLLDAGYEKQLLYSLDTTRARLKTYDKDAIGLDYILTTFNDKLKRAGISDQTIREISVENPVRMLTL